MGIDNNAVDIVGRRPFKDCAAGMTLDQLTVSVLKPLCKVIQLFLDRRSQADLVIVWDIGDCIARDFILHMQNRHPRRFVSKILCDLQRLFGVALLIKIDCHQNVLIHDRLLVLLLE